ncbi:ATP-binding protein [Hymenobacter cheonanensis]|uniref:ATP-binding protein n=1 Tax=Hymenobacter sp. CA2-7 TaxID=3063993 RepID=UPI002713C19C|nr:ATP-binding protein [Hymenobacter sp. CA2-7]MDO7883976.1 ATP-binding protein [Hymenobacter sp. CA2-7]
MALTLTPPAPGDTLARELDWLTKVLDARIRLHLKQECTVKTIERIPMPKLPTAATDAYARLVKHEKLNWHERLVLALALAPHLRPQALDPFFGRNGLYDRPFTEFGGLRGKGHAGFLPTGETALFLLAGADLTQRLPYQTSLWAHSPLATARLVQLGPAEAHEPPLSGALTVTPEALALLTTGERPRPHYSPDFPAQRVTTPLTWDDLVLEDYVHDQLREIRTWLDHQDEIMQDPHLRRHLKPGYRALFYGPPGTGKTLTAMLLGQVTGHEVYRVDLSMIVSKYIGETEKNLARVFDTAERRRWILFFDEADALFGKRTAASSSNDRHANQETAYLLQRIEYFPGVIILASNLKSNLDDAFARRFQAMINFPLPGSAGRLQLWQQAFATIKVSREVDFSALAAKYQVAGGAIVNVLRYCVLLHLQQKQAVSISDIMKGLQRELAKEGKTI